MLDTSPLKLALAAVCLLLLPIAGNIASAASDMTVPGTFSYVTDDSPVSDLVCFNATDGDFPPIQKLRKKYHSAWFCFDFDDTEKMKAAFGIPPSAKQPKNVCGYEGAATVILSNYKPGLDISSEDTAKLKKIISKNPARPISCSQ